MQVHLNPKIGKHLQALRRAGRKAALAASKAEEIIYRLQRGGVMPDKVGNVTKHGEARIKGVMKYDLGSGYRLVTLKNWDQLFLLYVGAHDDCHRWIENNRELTVEQIQERCIVLPVGETEEEAKSRDYANLPQEEAYDPLVDVSQRELREVFSGLVGGHNRII